MSQQIDEIRLQRLVDGDLGENERHAFLAGLDEQPELWREVALAFVEEQVWRNEIAGDGHCNHATIGKAQNVAPVRTAGRPWVAALALSVSLIVMLVVGFQLGGWQSRSQNVAGPIVDQTGGDENRTDSQVVDSPIPETREDLGSEIDSLESDFRIMLPHDEGQLVEMPLFEASEFDTASWESGDPMIVETLNRGLSRRGYRADWRTDYLTGRLDDGRQVVLPYRTVALKYLVQ